MARDIPAITLAHRKEKNVMEAVLLGHEFNNNVAYSSYVGRYVTYVRVLLQPDKKSM